MEWVGLALGVLGLGFALLPMAFPELPGYLRVPAGIAAALVIVGGVLLFFVPAWKRKQAKKKPQPLSVLRVFLSDYLEIYAGDNLSRALVALVRADSIKMYGVPGALLNVSSELQEIPVDHFDSHVIWVQWVDNECVSETYNPQLGAMALVKDKGRFFKLHASPNVLEELVKFSVEHPGAATTGLSGTEPIAS